MIKVVFQFTEKDLWVKADYDKRTHLRVAFRAKGSLCNFPSVAAALMPLDRNNSNVLHKGSFKFIYGQEVRDRNCKQKRKGSFKLYT